jgi:hypothetical protein
VSIARILVLDLTSPDLGNTLILYTPSSRHLNIDLGHINEVARLMILGIDIRLLYDTCEVLIIKLYHLIWQGGVAKTDTPTQHAKESLDVGFGS